MWPLTLVCSEKTEIVRDSIMIAFLRKIVGQDCWFSKGEDGWYSKERHAGLVMLIESMLALKRLLHGSCSHLCYRNTKAYVCWKGLQSFYRMCLRCNGLDGILSYEVGWYLVVVLEQDECPCWWYKKFDVDLDADQCSTDGWCSTLLSWSDQDVKIMIWIDLN